MVDSPAQVPDSKRNIAAAWAWVLSAAAMLLITVIVAAVVVIRPTFALTGPATLPPGTSVHGLDLTGVTPVEAIARIEQYAVAAEAEPIQLISEQRAVIVTRAELGWRLDIERLVDWLRELAVGRGTVDVRSSRLAALAPVVIEPSKLQAVLATHFAEDGTDPVPAEWAIENGELTVIPAEPGWQPSAAGLALAIFQQPFAEAYAVPFAATWPEVTEHSLRAGGIDGLRGMYRTYYYVSDKGRARNVELAAEAINGTWLMPGEELSFNAATDVVPDEAWQPATVIVGNEFVPGIGGGICQVSSTLYAAALVADIEVVSRTNHSLPVFYMDPGFDATVASGGPDLKLRNQTDAPIVITAVAADGVLTVRMYGRTVPGQEITLSNSIVSEHGPVAELYRTIRQDGVIVRTERVNRSVYYSP